MVRKLSDYWPAAALLAALGLPGNFTQALILALGFQLGFNLDKMSQEKGPWSKALYITRQWWVGCLLMLITPPAAINLYWFGLGLMLAGIPNALDRLQPSEPIQFYYFNPVQPKQPEPAPPEGEPEDADELAQKMGVI